MIELSNAYQLSVRRKLCTFNFSDGLADEIKVKGAKGKTEDEIKAVNDNDVLNKTKAYTWDDALTILDYVKNKK